MFSQLMKLSKGNPGALSCLMGMLQGSIEDSVSALGILPFIEDNQIVGTDLYVFWSDLCSKNYQAMEHLVKNCPRDILKEACSQQDYSGREMVKPYFEGFSL